MIPKPRSRIWVQYRAGQKDVVHELLEKAGAIFHYDFSDLDSFVVTLPENKLASLSGNPAIADYWYTSMMSQNEPILPT